jgi:hypothetical protein
MAHFLLKRALVPQTERVPMKSPLALRPCVRLVALGFCGAALLGGALHAQNLEQSFYTALYPSDAPFKGALDVPLFDPSLGTLVEARIVMTPHFSASLRAENTDTFAPQTVTLLFAGGVQLTREGHVLAMGTSGGYVSQFLMPFDGTVDYAGASGMMQVIHDDQDTTVSIPPSSPEFAAFIGQPGAGGQGGGGATAHFDVDGVLDPECEPVGNPVIVFEARTSIGPEITITYVYSTSGATFCAGDGSGNACPCSNAGASGHGCSSPFALNGALLTGSGDASVSADSLALTLTDLPHATMMVLMQGEGGSFSGTPFGAGLRCVSGAMIRIKTMAAGTSAVIGAGNGSGRTISAAGLVPPTGGTRYYQAAYREGPGACHSAGLNFSNGWRVAWRP